jgi:hypothetical protein
MTPTVRVANALHFVLGIGYCSMGQHEPGVTYRCLTDAAVVLAAIDGAPVPIPAPRQRALTLSARQPKGKK